MNKIVEGRIVKGVGGLYTVMSGDVSIECSARGIFRKDNITPLVGDFVEAEIINEKTLKGSINRIKSRKNALVRPKVSNVDQAVIVFAVRSPEINLDLLDKLLILIEEQSLPVTICINKIDLCKSEEYLYIKEEYEKIGYGVICASTSENYGIDSFKESLCDKVSVLAGPSGVGKSSLINALIPSLSLKTGGLSEKIERGKHTTRHAELIKAFDNAYIVDSPGFTSISTEHISRGQMPRLFREFRPFLDECRFADCVHIKETGCAIKENVGNAISESRYDRYVRLMLEIIERRDY